MVKIMDMTTGQILNDADRYGDEVLNANWLPQLALSLGLQTVASSPRKVADAGLTDIDGFMSRLYRAQE